MYVRSVNIRRFRHLEDVTLGPFRQPPQHSDLVALAGPNGGGKSSVLELLGFALSNSWSLTWTVARSFPESSFEIELGLSAEECDLARAWAAETNSAIAPAVVERLNHHANLYRSFNFSGGQYESDPTLHNGLFSLATNALRNHYQRSLGFFLRAERTYPIRGFQRDAIFQYPQTRAKTHSWNYAFNSAEAQYQDMFDYLAQLRYHYFAELGAFEHRRRLGDHHGVEPTDPLGPYDDLLQALFPGYRFAEESGEIPTNLFVTLPSGARLPFSDLSAGEKEVFFILSFFLRHDVTDAILVIDEPELHLHPELARTLLQQMMSIRPRNQVWVATHNAEVIDEAGRDRVTYITRDRDSHRAVVTRGVDEEDAVTILRDFFGFSGYIGIGRTLVFLEGGDASSDRKVFTTLFPEVRRLIRFIPAGGVENHARLNAAILKILESGFGWMKFYLVRDRDFLTDDVARHYNSHPSGKVYVLHRYHIENYLLNPPSISRVFREIYNKDLDEAAVRSRLHDAARGMSGEVAARMTAFRLNLVFRAQDFELGNFLSGQPIIDAGGTPHQGRIASLVNRTQGRVKEISSTLAAEVESAEVERLVSACVQEVTDSLSGEGWLSTFPGRDLLRKLASAEEIGPYVALQNSIIKTMAENPLEVPAELTQVLAAIQQDGPLTAF